MTIGIDAHNLEGKRTGAGRYLFNLLKEWSKLAESEGLMTNSKFVLYFKDEISADLQPIPSISPSLREGESKGGWLDPNLFECKLLNVASNAKFTHWNLPRAAARDRVDILFCPAYVAPLFYKGRIALALHDISYEARPKEFNWLSVADRILLKWVSRKSAEKAAIIFAPSEFSRQEIIKYYGEPAGKIITLPLAVDPSLFEDFGHNVESAIKQKYNIKDKFIFFIGSIFTRRHLSEVIAAFGHLAQENNNYQLLLAGQDCTKNRIVDKLAGETNKKLGRKAILRVDFINENELKLLYSACAFFIWLSDYEGFGLPVLEAMSLGAPVITSDGSSLREVAGEAALLIKDNSEVKEIYRAMNVLTRDDALREELAAKGREQATKFSWRKCAEKTLEKLLISN